MGRREGKGGGMHAGAAFGGKLRRKGTNKGNVDV